MHCEVVCSQLMRHRGKSSHDLLDDDRLSVIPAVIVEDDKDDEDVPMATTKRPRDDQSGQVTAQNNRSMAA